MSLINWMWEVNIKESVVNIPMKIQQLKQNITSKINKLTSKFDSCNKIKLGTKVWVAWLLSLDGSFHLLFEKTLEALHLLYEGWEIAIHHWLDEITHIMPDFLVPESKHWEQIGVFYTEAILIAIILLPIIYSKSKKIIDFHKENEFNDIIKEYWFIIKDYWYIVLPIIYSINSSLGVM